MLETPREEKLSPEEERVLREEDARKRRDIVARNYPGGPDKFKQVADRDAAEQRCADARAREELVLVID